MAFNFGGFFGSGSSNSSNNIFGSFNFSDYSAIRNGSYAKLLKSYYKKDVKDSGSKSETDKADNRVKFDPKDTTGLSKMKKESDSLASSVEALGKKDLWEMKDGEYDMDKIASAVKSFVSNYNDTISQADKVTNSGVSKQVDNMESMTNVMSKILSKIGITAGVDGKLSVNEDTIKSAKIDDIKSAFVGTHSYAAQIEKYANDISKATINGSSVYGADGSLTSALQGNFNSWM